ncbi:hypothetical protein MA16_Dca024410 [Dendrobium catenatum]|uniref:DNA helicase n=1 Tax=Dendrobium catenatum TaxID=906689 RepID=A0A2I0VVA3_9ASPA|nr:hypothetical protein MA16_Dca024410 [Dendrobium catenatum]
MKASAIVPQEGPPADVVQAFVRFLLSHHTSCIRSILFINDLTLHYPIVIDFAELLEFDPPLAYHLFSHPTDVLPLFDQAAHISQTIVLDGSEGIEARGSPKKFVHVRINVTGSPLECPETFPNIGRLRVKHRGILLTVKGTVIRSGAVKMIEGERVYACRKCRHRFKVYPELEIGNAIRLPTSCPSRNSKICEGTSFQSIPDSIVCHDYQEIKIQENTQVLGVGSMPRSIPIILTDDLVDVVKAGGFDANKERIGSGHNRYFVVPFDGKITRFRGPQVITVYHAVPFGGKTAGDESSTIERRLCHLNLQALLLVLEIPIVHVGETPMRFILAVVSGVDVEAEDRPHHATSACIGLTCLVAHVAPDSLLPCYKSAYRGSTDASSASRTGFELEIYTLEDRCTGGGGHGNQGNS